MHCQHGVEDNLINCRGTLSETSPIKLRSRSDFSLSNFRPTSTNSGEILKKKKENAFSPLSNIYDLLSLDLSLFRLEIYVGPAAFEFSESKKFSVSTLLLISKRASRIS